MSKIYRVRHCRIEFLEWDLNIISAKQISIFLLPNQIKYLLLFLNRLGGYLCRIVSVNLNIICFVLLCKSARKCLCPLQPQGAPQPEVVSPGICDLNIKLVSFFLKYLVYSITISHFSSICRKSIENVHPFQYGN